MAKRTPSQGEGKKTSFAGGGFAGDGIPPDTDIHNFF